MNTSMPLIPNRTPPATQASRIPRLLGALCALAFCSGQIQAAPEDASASPVRLTIELRDGSHLVGTNVDDALSFRTASMGDMKLPWSGIHLISYEGSNTSVARLTATNGDGLAITLAADSLRVTTAFGQTEMPVKLIRNLWVSSSPGGTSRRGGTGTGQLVIELRDDSRVVGKGLDDTLIFHSPAMGDLKLTWSGIRSIEYAGTNTEVLRGL